MVKPKNSSIWILAMSAICPVRESAAEAAGALLLTARNIERFLPMSFPNQV